MYNRYQNGTEAYYLMSDAVAADQELDSAQDSYNEVLERAIGQVDDQCDQITELEDENKRLEEERDEFKAKYMATHAIASELIEILTQTLLVGEKMADFSRARLVLLGALNETEDSDSGSGDSRDDSAESTGDSPAKSTPSTGLKGSTFT